MSTNFIKNTEPVPIVCVTDFSKASTEVSAITVMIANVLRALLELAFTRNCLAGGATSDTAAEKDESYQFRLEEGLLKLEKRVRLSSQSFTKTLQVMLSSKLLQIRKFNL